VHRGNDPEVPAGGRTPARPPLATTEKEGVIEPQQRPDPEILRGTSDQLATAISETAALERRKRGIRPADPGFPALALDVRRAAERVLLLARQEEVVARDIAGEPGAATIPPLEHVSPAKELATILEEWRAVEHSLVEAEAGSAEAEALRRRFDELRDRYAEALKARRQRG
jgi:hypothetical protein